MQMTLPAWVSPIYKAKKYFRAKICNKIKNNQPVIKAYVDHL